MAKRLSDNQRAYLMAIATGDDPVSAYRGAYNCDGLSDDQVYQRAYSLADKLHLLGKQFRKRSENEARRDDRRAANLVPVLTTEDARSKGRAGGRASGVRRRENASLRAAAKAILSLDCQDDNAVSVMAAMGLEDGELTNAAMLTTAMVLKAGQGDVKAFEALTKVMPDTAAEGEPPTTKPQADYAMLLSPAFLALHRDIAEHRYTDYMLPGGRGSAKSSDVALEIPRILDMDDQAHAVCLRKVANTLRTSVYAKLTWAIAQAGRMDEFHFSVSPMEITKVATGQKIYFFGLNEPEKYKSFSPAFGRVAIEWFEEADQYRGMDEIRSVNQTFTRGPGDVWRFYTWNPPRSHRNWLNKEVRREVADRHVYPSSYLQMPREWLGEQFFEDAENLKAINETAYRHEYLGEDVGTDGEVFQNVSVREITQEERNGFRWIRRGVDWGYATDPWVFVSVAYDRKTKTVYIFQEAYGRRLADEKTTAKARELMTETDDQGNTFFLPRKPINTVYADNEDPKSVATWNELGINTVSVYKWPGSVDAGIHWLQTRTSIVIDKSCALATEEFCGYEYVDDGDGGLKTYPDKNNHTIDAVRYALSTIIADKKET